MCVIDVSVDDKRRRSHLSLWIFSPLHYSVLHFYVTSSSLITVKSFRVDKSWKLQAETKIFQLPLLSSSKHKSEAQCLFCFCYHSCMKKMYIKGLFADLQWLGEHQELSEEIQKEEIQSSVLSHGRCFPRSSVFAYVCPRGGFRYLHRIHPLAQVLGLFECSLNVPSWNRFSLSLPACPCWQVELRNWEPVWRTWEGFKIAGCFEKVQLESGGLREHLTELEPQTDREKGWAGWVRGSGGPALIGVQSWANYFPQFQSGNLSFPRSIPEEQKCQWSIHFQYISNKDRNWSLLPVSWGWCLLRKNTWFVWFFGGQPLTGNVWSLFWSCAEEHACVIQKMQWVSGVLREL